MPNLVNEQELFFKAFEPKMANRFILYADGLPAYVIKGVARPTVSQDAKVLNHINVQRYVKGRTVWGAMQMTLFDPIVPSSAQSVMEWVRLHHESVTGRDGYAEFYKKDLTIPMRLPLSMEYDILPGMDLSYKVLDTQRFDIGTPERLNRFKEWVPFLEPCSSCNGEI